MTLCEGGCDYESFDTEKLTVSCRCKVSDDKFSDTGLNSANVKYFSISSLDNSTFGIIKCYQVVFDFANNLKNIGFWIFLIIIVAHILLYVLFFINGITPIKKYVIEEMNKFGYYKNIIGLSPPKKHAIRNTLNNINENNVQTSNEMIEETGENTVKKFNISAQNSKGGQNENIISVQPKNIIIEEPNEIKNHNQMLWSISKTAKLLERKRKINFSS